MQNYFHLTIFISVGAKKLMSKKSKEDEQTLEELKTAHRLSQAKCQLVQTSYIKQIKLFLFLHIINILLAELSRSVWKDLDLAREYRPLYVRSVLTTSVKILPDTPPARLTRAKNLLAGPTFNFSYPFQRGSAVFDKGFPWRKCKTILSEIFHGVSAATKVRELHCSPKYINHFGRNS